MDKLRSVPLIQGKKRVMAVISVYDVGMDFICHNHDIVF